MDVSSSSRFFRVMPKRMSNGLEMNKYVCVQASLERKRATMHHRMTFIEHHFPRFHRNVVSTPIVSVDFDWPIFVDILCHINNRRAHQRQSIHMRRKHSPFVVCSDPVQRTRSQFLSGPFLEHVFCGCPYLTLDTGTGTSKSSVFHAYHLCWRCPMVCVSISCVPVLGLSAILIFIPEFFDDIKNFIWCLNLLKAQFRVILHRPRLSHVHCNPVAFSGIAQPFPALVLFMASFNQAIIDRLSVAQWLNRHINKLCRSAVVRRIYVVRQFSVIRRNGCMVYRK
mmetsp:Transcript_48830/g.72551  ORF Transcript_48830/g.72551 Transcript_48830/m.72551 type:complete len:282 (+) Transcript_48830:479-1324(+)